MRDRLVGPSKSMKLSVIIPALNEASRIADAVERAWQLEPHEVIVADGGSVDGTVSLAREAGAGVLQARRGRACQQNAAARVACGDVLLFLHADCWLEPVAREQLDAWFALGRIPGGAFQQRIEADGLVYRLLEIGNTLRVCMPRSAYGDQGLFFRREAFDRLGGFPNVRLMEDVLITRKLKQLGRLQLLPGPLHVDARRWQTHGVIRQTLRNWFLLSAERLGVSTEKLSELYLPHWTKKRV